MTTKSAVKVTDEEYNGIMKSLNYNKEELELSVQSIREWLKKEPHLPDAEDDKILLAMLMLSKCSIEQTKKKLDAYYSFKNMLPELYTNGEPLNPTMQKTMSENIFLPFPKLTENYSRVILIKTESDAQSISYIDCLRYAIIGLELCLKHDYACHNDVIIDMSGITAGHLKTMPIPLIIKCVKYISNVFPNSVKGFHCLNAPAFMQSIIQLIKSALKNKLAERVYIHNDLESLHKYVPKNVLAQEYGGTAGSLADIYGEWRQFVESNNDWVKVRQDIKSNENLRIGTTDYSNIYGVEGSFRQLTVD
ncbi:uncharacterized protein CBL_02403 [Carabus blaptoides fortunei]